MWSYEKWKKPPSFCGLLRKPKLSQKLQKIRQLSCDFIKNLARCVSEEDRRFDQFLSKRKLGPILYSSLPAGPESSLYPQYIYQDSKLLVTVFYFAEPVQTRLLNQFKPVSGPFGQRYMHSNLDFCPSLARQET